MVKPRGQDPMRPSTPAPADSWWTKPMSRAEFDAKAAQEAERMKAVTVAYNKPGTVPHLLIERSWPAVLRNFPDATIEATPDGRHAVAFTANGHHVKTWLPVGFPVASPAYFWTSPDDAAWVRACFDDESPRRPSLQRAPNGEAMLWWIFKPSKWNPNQHTALTWLHQISDVIRHAESKVTR